MRDYEPRDGICSACGCPTHTEMVDMGIGPYEFWGAKCKNIDLQELSACCNADVIEGGYKVLLDKMCVAAKCYPPNINKGDRYRKVVYRVWRKNGPSWIRTIRRKY